MQKPKKITKKDILSGFGILLRLLSRYKHDMVVFVSLGIVTSVANAFIPYIVGGFVDALIVPEQIFSLHHFNVPMYLALLAAWALVSVLLLYTVDHMSRYSDTMGVKVYTEYLVSSFTHILRLPLSFHKKNKMGEIFQKIDITGNNIENIVAGTFIQLSPQLLSIVFALGVTFYISPLLGGFLFTAMLLYLVIFIRGVEPLASLQSEAHKEIGKTWGNTYDFIMNTRQIKEVSAERDVKQKMYAGFRGRMVGIWNRMHHVSADLSLYQQVIILLTQFSIFVYSIWAVLGGAMTIGELLAVNAYTSMVFGPFVILGRTWKNVQNGIININETEKILRLKEEAYTPKNHVNLDVVRGDIEFRNVDFYYNKNKPILKNISFTAKQGQTIAIVGESGVGKTTLVDLLLAFHFPKKGSIEIDGVNIKKIGLRQLRDNVAVVSQDIVLFNDTILNNISFGKIKAKSADIKDAAEKAYAKDFIQDFPQKWQQEVGERGIKLSGGQRQRVALARAILRDPAILILDEPTSALDARTEKHIQESLEDIVREKTTFIIAHRFSTVRNADKIIVMKAGEIAETGTHAELMKVKDGEYRKLYDLQIGLHG